MVGDERCNVITLYRSSSQLQDQFESFKENLELNFESVMQNNPFLIVLLGKFMWNQVIGVRVTESGVKAKQ